MGRKPQNWADDKQQPAVASALLTPVRSADPAPAPLVCPEPAPQLRAASFAGFLSVKAAGQNEAQCLLFCAMLPVAGGLIGGGLRAAGRGAALALALQAAVPLLCLALLRRAPAAYSRHIWHVRLLVQAVMAAGHLTADMARMAEASIANLQRNGLMGSLTWAGVLAAASSVTVGLLVLLQLQLPPVAMIGSTGLWAASAAARNGSLCRSTFMEHPESVWRVEVAYRVLEPLIAPLEPLLLAAGIKRSHPRRRCHCVLAALHFWLLGVLPTALAAVRQVRAYKAWRAERRRLDRERRRRQAEGWGFGFKEPSSSSDPSTSGGSSGSQSASDNSGGELPRIADLPVQLASNAAIAQLLPALVQPLHATVPHMRGARRRSVHAHHPDDWQWVHAGHVLHALHPGIAGAALAAFFAAVLAGWHRIAFP